MRIYLAGQKAFGAAAFAAIRKAGHEIVQVSAPALRDNGQLPDRLRDAAERACAPWLEAGRLRADLMPGGVDLIVCAHSHDFIGRKTRMKTRLGAIGYHPSLLPRHRGRDAVRWTVHMRDPIAGGSVYWLSDAMDGGPVATQEHVFVAPDDTAESLWREKLAPLGTRLLMRVIGDLERGLILARPQNEAYATWEPSWSRAPAVRPDLDLIGALPAGYRLDRGEGC